MVAYAFVIIWLVSHAICLYIAKRKNIKLTFLWRMFGVFLGPLAIPFVILTNQNDKT